MTTAPSLAPERGRRAQAAAAGATGHFGSHRVLVSNRTGSYQRGSLTDVLDAVAVPAARAAENLAHAAGVARLSGATLVVMASRHTEPAEAAAVAGRWLPPERVVVVPFAAADPGRALGLTFRADAMSAAIQHRDVDTSAKRNAALALAAMVGWRRILFLDDDVRGFGRSQLGMLRAGFAPVTRGSCAVGWTFDDFPDNSVVCHAHRRSGGQQETFIGAGALAVQLGDRVPHFPQLYNEDWLFLLPLMRARRAVLAGALRQLPYDPFADPGRAARQEFGDVLAEGLFRHAHLRLPRSALSTQGYWRDVVSVRGRLIRSIRARLEGSSDPEAPAMLACLAAADTTRQHSWAPLLAEYMGMWRQDSRDWQRRMAGLPRGLTVAQALAQLGLGLQPGLPARPAVRRVPRAAVLRSLRWGWGAARA